jgi:hypothetical protein
MFAAFWPARGRTTMVQNWAAGVAANTEMSAGNLEGSLGGIVYIIDSAGKNQGILIGIAVSHFRSNQPH